jgi:hypothetical protein
LFVLIVSGTPFLEKVRVNALRTCSVPRLSVTSAWMPLV